MTPLEAVARTPDLVETVSDRLWGMYNAGYEFAGVWSDSAMSDAEQLISILGLTGNKFNAEDLKARVQDQIPIECKKIARAAIIALAENVSDGMLAAGYEATHEQRARTPASYNEINRSGFSAAIRSAADE
jgi:hypothetical protein